MIGKFHNARRCIGSDYFVAYLCDDAGRMLPGWRNVDAFDSESDARDWLDRESSRRGDRVSRIEDVTTQHKGTGK